MAGSDTQPGSPQPRKGGAEARKRSAAPDKCCDTTAGACPESRCRIEAIVPIDARGQMVLPKALREKAGIRAGDNLMVVAWEKEGKVCCLTILRSDVVAHTVSEFVTP